MSGRLRVLLWLCCFCAFGLRAEEAIQAYDVRMQVEPSGDVLVTERIAVMAEGKMIVRGIYRDIPVRYRLGNGLLCRVVADSITGAGLGFDTFGR